MSETIFTIIGLLIGIMILGTGVYYFWKNRKDAESRKIYGITSVVGAVLVVGMLVWMIFR